MKIIILGSQGSGKSTQSKIVAEKYKLPHIEMSNLLREKRNQSDQDAKIISKALSSGNLVSDEVTIRTLKDYLSKPECQKGYVLDGYPRTEIQFKSLEGDIDKVFYIKISDQEAYRRLNLRQREDDTAKLLKRRIQLFHQETEPQLDFFRQRGILEEVDGERTIEEVAKDIQDRIYGIKRGR